MATKTIITWEEFVAAGEEWQRREWVDEEIVYMTPVNFEHEIALAQLVAYLVEYCRVHPEWVCVCSNAAFTLSSGNWRQPDVSLVRKDRLPTGELPAGQASFAPDVAFEILSPSNTPSYIQRKRKDYQESGVIQVWIDLEKRLVELIYPDRPLQYFREDQPLVIDQLLGFSLDLKTLYSI